MGTKDEFAVTVQLSYLLASDIGVLGDEAIVIDALHHAKGEVTENNIQETIEDLFHVSVSFEGLKRTLSSLYKQNKLYKEGKRLVIAPQTLEEITKVVLEVCDRHYFDNVNHGNFSYDIQACAAHISIYRNTAYRRNYYDICGIGGSGNSGWNPFI